MRTLSAQAWPIVRNDLRLFWRELQGGRTGFASYALLLLLLAILHVTIVSALFGLKAPPPPGVEVLGGTILTLMMLGAAMNRAVLLLYTRSDFDLLLSSPMPARAVLLARLASVALTAFLTVGIFAAPVFNGAMLHFSPRYAAGYLVLALVSVLVSAVGTAGTLFLVRWFGATRARLIAIAIAAGLGSCFPLLSILPAVLSKAQFRDLQQGFTQAMQHPALAFVAGANRGSPLPLLLLALVTAGAVVVTLRLLTRTFVSRLQDSQAVVNRRRPNVRHRWIEGLVPATLRKEFRLIFRSPLLLVHLLPLGFMLLPATILLPKVIGLRVLAPVTLFIAALFSFSLCEVASAGEVGWDLVRLSPASESRLRRLKMATGMAVPFSIAALLSGWIALAGRPGLALVTLVTSVICAAGCAWVAVVTIAASPRYDLIQAPNPSIDLRQMLAFIILFPGTLGLGFVSFGFNLLSAPFLGLALICVIASFTLLEPRSAS